MSSLRIYNSETDSSLCTTAMAFISSVSPSAPFFHFRNSLPPPFIYFHLPLSRRSTRNPPSLTRSSSSEYRTVSISSPPAPDAPREDLHSASDVVRNFYGGINARDFSSVEDLIAEDCVYEDLVFSRPFIGRQETLRFFKSFSDSISRDLQFVIDDLSSEDTSAVGVTWHLEWKGKPFPFSKGCSFYRLDVSNGKRQIVYARDVVEPAIKPGETALTIIRGVTWLLERFPRMVDSL